MRKRKKVKSNHYLYILPVIVLVGVLVYFDQNVVHHSDDEFPFDLPSRGDTVIVPTDEIVHNHFDFKVFLEGEEVDFDRDEFDTVNRFIHLHLENVQGDKVVHVHARDLEIGFFFNSLGMKFSSECFETDDEQFCNEEKKLRFFVNGEENFEFGEYIANDLDRILITYGSTDEEIQQQIESVTDYACIPSGKCPDRGISDIVTDGLNSI